MIRNVRNTVAAIGAAAALASAQADYRIATWPDFRKGAMYLGFDDNNDDQFSIALPLLDAHGIPCTFFLVTGTMTPAKWDLAKAAAAKGHDMGTNTVSDNSFKPMIDQGQWDRIESELRDSKAAVEAHIPGPPCVSFAYSHGDYRGTDRTKNVFALVAKYFIAARGVDAQVHSDTGINFFTSVGFDADGIPVASMDAGADSAIHSGGYFGEFAHHVTADQAAAFGQHLDHIQAKRDSGVLWVTTFGNIFRYIAERRAAKLAPKAATAQALTLSLTDTLVDSVYDYPLTLKVKLPDGWTAAGATQAGKPLPTQSGDGYATFAAVPDGGDIVLSPATASGLRAAAPRAARRAGGRVDALGRNRPWWGGLLPFLAPGR